MTAPTTGTTRRSRALRSLGRKEAGEHRGAPSACDEPTSSEIGRHCPRGSISELGSAMRNRRRLESNSRTDSRSQPYPVVKSSAPPDSPTGIRQSMPDRRGERSTMSTRQLHRRPMPGRRWRDNRWSVAPTFKSVRRAWARLAGRWNGQYGSPRQLRDRSSLHPGSCPLGASRGASRRPSGSGVAAGLRLQRQL